jgi:hypothetical protein
MKKTDSNRKTLFEYWFLVVVFLMVYCIVPMLNYFIYEAVMAEHSGTFDILFFVQYEHWLTENQTVYWISTFLIWVGNIYVVYWSIERGIQSNSRRDWHVFSWVFAFGFVANACTYVARPDSVQHDFEFVPLYYSVGSSNLIVCQRFGWQCYSMWKIYKETRRRTTKTLVMMQAAFIMIYLSTTHQLFMSTIGFSIVLVYMVDRWCETDSYKKMSDEFLSQLQMLKKHNLISDKVEFPATFTIDEGGDNITVADDEDEDEHLIRNDNGMHVIPVTQKGYGQVPMNELIDHGDVIEEKQEEIKPKKDPGTSKLNGIDTEMMLVTRKPDKSEAETVVFAPEQYITM